MFFLVGVFVRSFIFIDVFWLYVAALGLLTAALLHWSTPRWRWLFLGGLCLLGGVYRYQLSLPVATEATIWFYNGQSAVIQGVVSQEPDLRINQVKLTVKTTKLKRDNQWQPVHGNVLLSVSLYPEYRYGDLIEFRCQLKKPEAFNGFAYDRYLAKNGIYSLCYYPAVKLISHDQASSAIGAIFWFKGQLQLMINRNLPEPQASLFSGLLLGSRRGIPDLLNEQFNITNTSHLIAISGSHITVIVGVLLELLLAAGLWRRQAFWAITVILIIYVILIGFPTSAVRAAVMGWLVMLATNVGRVSKPGTIITLAAAVMVGVNPLLLRDDAGFQLSFAAVLGIVYLMPFFDQWLEKLPSVGGLKAVLSMTLAAQLATLPLMVIYFGRLSLIGTVANLLVVPVFTYLLIGGFISLGLSFLIPALSLFFFWPIWLMLTYTISVIAFLAGVPFAAINL